MICIWSHLQAIRSWCQSIRPRTTAVIKRKTSSIISALEMRRAVKHYEPIWICLQNKLSSDFMLLHRMLYLNLFYLTFYNNVTIVFILLYYTYKQICFDPNLTYSPSLPMKKEYGKVKFSCHFFTISHFIFYYIKI